MHNIWAVAKNTIKQALRTKSALALILILLVLLPAMGLTTTGDGTLKGRLQTFISYGLSLTSLLLCLLTIVLIVFTVTNDIKQKQVFTVLTKPIRRYELILGKLFGVIIFDFCLLAIFATIIYSITLYIPRGGDYSQQQLAQVKKEFFTARNGMIPVERDISKEVNDTYEQLRESGQLEHQQFRGMTKKKIIQYLTNRRKLWEYSAQPGGRLVWEFKNIKPVSKDDSLFIRFQYEVSVNPPDLQVSGGWLVGDLRQLEMGGQPTTPILEFPRKDQIRTFYEIEVPSAVVADDGYLAVGFINFPEKNSVLFGSIGFEFFVISGCNIIMSGCLCHCKYQRIYPRVFFIYG
jgi:hypothetical protein